jgi:hypothetical protein
MEDRKVKQVLSGGWYQWERVKEDEYGENIMYSSMKMKKMRPFETFQNGRGNK